MTDGNPQGSTTFPFPFSKEPAGHAEVLCVQYPGRQDRRAEPPLDDVAALVEQIHRALQPRTDKPLVLFGHSTGAVLPLYREGWVNPYPTPVRTPESGHGHALTLLRKADRRNADPGRNRAAVPSSWGVARTTTAMNTTS
ncbi:thioesterase II family protein [Streptomyces lavendulae]|uniref:thioesterase II family protein n=1 Tax=Streptomyces lavendulae TaxID=1914 RepID=UPI0036A52687